jgi:hypothetical protein
VIQSEAYAGDKEQRKQGYPRRYQLKSPAKARSDPGACGWETPGRLIAQAFWGRRGLRGSLGGRVGASSCRRMQALANMAGLGILETNSTPIRTNHDSKFFSNIK